MCVCVCVTLVLSETPVCPGSGEAVHAGRRVSITLNVLRASRSAAFFPETAVHFLLLLLSYFPMAHSDVIEEPISRGLAVKMGNQPLI